MGVAFEDMDRPSKINCFVNFSRKILGKLRVRFFLALDPLVQILASKHRGVGNGVLLIRLDNIGDFILWLDTAKEYRRLYPKQKITLIANAIWADFARHFSFWDEVWPIQTHAFGRNLFYRWSVLHRVRQAGFETVVQPTFSRVLMHGDSLIRASAAQHRIGSVGDLANISVQDKARSDRWYTRLISAKSQPVMELERNAEFISQLANAPYFASLPRIPVLQALPENLQPDAEYFILFPGASWSGRRWRVSSFADLLLQLRSQFGWQVVLCGSRADTVLCADIVAASGQNSCINLVGRTSLAELTELIRGARLLVGNDTSAVHIAAAVATPAVGILGGGHYGRFMPYPEAFVGIKPVAATYPMPCYGCNWHCTQPHEAGAPVPCISQISIAMVMASAQEALSQEPAASMTCQN